MKVRVKHCSNAGEWWVGPARDARYGHKRLLLDAITKIESERGTPGDFNILDTDTEYAGLIAVDEEGDTLEIRKVD